MHGLKCIFFYFPLPPSGTLQLVETLEEEILILRDGHPFGGYRWTGDQITDAVDTFRRLAASLRETLPADVFTDRRAPDTDDADAHHRSSCIPASHSQLHGA
jgi:hypothetical protein